MNRRAFLKGLLATTAAAPLVQVETFLPIRHGLVADEMLEAYIKATDLMIRNAYSYGWGAIWLEEGKIPQTLDRIGLTQTFPSTALPAVPFRPLSKPSLPKSEWRTLPNLPTEPTPPTT